MSRRRSKRIESRVECITITDSEDDEAVLPRQQAIEDLSDVEDVTPHALIIQNRKPVERKESPRPTTSKRIQDSPEYSPSRRSAKISRKSKPKIRKNNFKMLKTSKELETPPPDESKSGSTNSSGGDTGADDWARVANVSTVFEKSRKGSTSYLSCADSPSGPSSPSSSSSMSSDKPLSSDSVSSTSSSDTPVIRAPRRMPIQAIDQANRPPTIVDDDFERTPKVSKSSDELPKSSDHEYRGSSSSPEPQPSADATNMISTPLPKKRVTPPKIQDDEQKDSQRATQMEREAPPPQPPRRLMLEHEQDIKHRARRRQLALDKIIGVFKDPMSGRVDFVVKWRGLADMERVPFREMSLLFPSKVLDYMFARIQWCK